MRFILGLSVFVFLLSAGLSFAAERPSDDVVFHWTAEGVKRIVSYVYSNQNNGDLRPVADYFTEKGLDSFKKSLKQSRTTGTIDYDVNDVVVSLRNDPRVKVFVHRQGMQWVADVPVSVQMPQNRLSPDFVVTVHVSEKELGQPEQESGLGIDSIIMAPSASCQTFECRTYDRDIQAHVRDRLAEMNFVRRWLYLKSAETAPSVVEDLLTDEMKATMREKKALCSNDTP